MAKKLNVEKHMSQRKNLEELTNKSSKIETKRFITEAIDSPSPEKISAAVQVVEKDDSLSLADKQQLKASLLLQLSEIYSLHNLSDDYITLKKEAKELLKFVEYSFIAMAQRLRKIRDKELYKFELDDKGQRKYWNFKDFIKNELVMSRATVYNYISVYDLFEEEILGLKPGEVVEYSKVSLLLPLMRADEQILSISKKEDLKHELWEEAKHTSFNDLKQKISTLKKEVGLVSKRANSPRNEKLSQLKKTLGQILLGTKNNALLLEISHTVKEDDAVASLVEFITNDDSLKGKVRIVR